MFKLTPIVKNLLIVNVALFIIEHFLDVPLSDFLSYHCILGDSFEPYQIITYMFVHAGGFHLFSNMFALIIFGPLLEQVLGQKRFLIFYFVTGIGAGLLYAGVNFWEIYQVKMFAQDFINNPSPYQLIEFVNKFNLQPTHQGYDLIYDIYPNNPNNILYQDRAINFVEGVYITLSNSGMLGASGAVFGILMGFGLLFPNMRLILIFPPIPVRAKYLVAFYALYAIYAMIQQNPDDNIAHLAHIGGMLFAFILFKMWKLKKTDIG